MAARRNSKAPKVDKAAQVARLTDIWEQVHALQAEGREIMVSLGLITEGDDKADKPAPRKPSPRKPKADTPKDDRPWIAGCTFTYVKANGSESQHRIVRTEGESVIARALASGQERPWKLTTLAAMLQTKNVKIKATK